MTLTQTPALTADATYSRLVSQTDAPVRAAFSATAAGVWDRTVDSQQRVVLQLRVTDVGGGEVLTTFTPEEVANVRHAEKRLRGLGAAVGRVGEWKRTVAELFNDIRVWASTLPGGAAVVSESPLTLLEERSGAYSVSALTLRRGDAEMKVVPVASWVVGADGRVDLTGPGGPFVLIYTKADGWQYVRERYPTVTLEPLTQDLFHRLAQACLDA